MDKGKKIRIILTSILLLLLLGFIIWFLSFIFEGEAPTILLESTPKYLTKDKTSFNITIKDRKRGLKTLNVTICQEEREVSIYEQKFPFKGLFNNDGIHEFNMAVDIDPKQLALSQGRIDLEIRVRDYSRRNGGDGNLAFVTEKMVLDTISPLIRAISRNNNAKVGGTGLLVYQTSSDSVESGVFVDDIFFPGYPANQENDDEMKICYFAIPYDVKDHPDLFLWAKDSAGNISNKTFYCYIGKKRFRKDKIKITDSFLRRVLPYFSYYIQDSQGSDIENFLRINNELREKDNQTLKKIISNPDPGQLWNGTWLRMKNSATMARFADHRSYFYKGSKIDTKYHMGIDLASLSNSKVGACNHGIVIFTGHLGIYGMTVVLDHGQGLASMYSHLSEITVEDRQKVSQGDIIGLTGKTGLAGGDHLHFSIMVNGVFVNPVEWWDSHWIRNNVSQKLALLKQNDSGQ